MVFFGNRKERQRLKDKVDNLEYENASLANTLYNIGGNLVYGSQIISWAQNQTTTFTVPTDPYVIYKTCGPIHSAIHKIMSWISKYSWNLNLDNVNERESFTSIIRKTVIDLLWHGNGYWDISNGLIYCIPAGLVKVEWDKLASSKNKSSEFQKLLGDKKYSIKDEDGTDIQIDRENIVHFILEPNAIELKGSSKISSIQNEINTYYYLCNAASKKYNLNEIGKFIINFGIDTDPQDAQSFKQKILLNQNPNEPYAVTTNKMDVHEFNQNDKFGSDYIAIQEWFGKIVYTIFGMSETDRGEISATKASAEVHQYQTQSTLIEPILDVIAEEWNQSKLKDKYGEFEWREPEVEEDIKEESQQKNKPKLVKDERKDNATSI